MHGTRQQSFGDVMQLSYYKQHIVITNRQFALHVHVRTSLLFDTDLPLELRI